MADPTATLTLDKDTYVHGETITATYTVAGVDELTDVAIHGTVTVNGKNYDINADTIKIGDQVAYVAPTADGLTFTATDNPRAFTAVA